MKKKAKKKAKKSPKKKKASKPKAKKRVVKKKAAKRPAVKKAKKAKPPKKAVRPKVQPTPPGVPPKPTPPPGAVKVGTVSHFFDKISVGAIKLEKPVKVGDRLRFLGRHTDFEQTAESMQIEHEVVQSADGGAEIGLKVSSPVREGDDVYRV